MPEVSPLVSTPPPFGLMLAESRILWTCEGMLYASRILWTGEGTLYESEYCRYAKECCMQAEYSGPAKERCMKANTVDRRGNCTLYLCHRHRSEIQTSCCTAVALFSSKNYTSASLCCVKNSLCTLSKFTWGSCRTSKQRLTYPPGTSRP